MQEYKDVWINKSSLSFQDKIVAGISLNISIASSYNEEYSKYGATTISFCISDGRNKLNNKVLINLEYNNLITLLSNLSLLDVDKSLTWKMGFSASNIIITRNYFKSKKDLVIKFIIVNNSEFAQIQVNDTVSSNSNMKIHIDMDSFKSLYLYLRSIVTNFVLIETSIMNAINTNIIIKSLFDIKNNTDLKFSTISNQINTLYERIDNINIKTEPITVSEVDLSPSIKIDNFKNEEIISNSDIEPALPEIIESTEIQVGDYKDIVLEETFPPEDKVKINKPVTIKNSELSFNANFLDYDLLKLGDWITGFINFNETTDDKYYSIFGTLLSFCKIKMDEKLEITSSKNYYLYQYHILKNLKEQVKSYLLDGKLPKNNFFSFDNKIKKGTDLYEIGMEILVCLILYYIVYASYIKSIKDIDKSNNKNKTLADNYTIIYIGLKTIFNVFIFSLESIDKSDVSNIFRKYINSPILNNFKKKYSDMVIGGNINISTDIFESHLMEFLNAYYYKEKYLKVSSIESIYNISIKSPSDIKKEIIKNFFTHEEEKILSPVKNDVVVEQIEQDEKTKLFIDCCQKFKETVPGFVEKVEKECKNFKDITLLFKKFDIPSAIYKIKRIIDINDKIKTKTEVIEIFRNYKEDESVTQNRVMANEQKSNEDYSVDNLQIINSLNL